MHTYMHTYARSLLFWSEVTRKHIVSQACSLRVTLLMNIERVMITHQRNKNETELDTLLRDIGSNKTKRSKCESNQMFRSFF